MDTGIRAARLLAAISALLMLLATSPASADAADVPRETASFPFVWVYDAGDFSLPRPLPGQCGTEISWCSSSFFFRVPSQLVGVSDSGGDVTIERMLRAEVRNFNMVAAQYQIQFSLYSPGWSWERTYSHQESCSLPWLGPDPYNLHNEVFYACDATSYEPGDWLIDITISHTPEAWGSFELHFHWIDCRQYRVLGISEYWSRNTCNL